MNLISPVTLIRDWNDGTDGQRISIGFTILPPGLQRTFVGTMGSWCTTEHCKKRGRFDESEEDGCRRKTRSAPDEQRSRRLLQGCSDLVECGFLSRRIEFHDHRVNAVRAIVAITDMQPLTARTTPCCQTPAGRPPVRPSVHPRLAKIDDLVVANGFSPHNQYVRRIESVLEGVRVACVRRA